MNKSHAYECIRFSGEYKVKLFLMIFHRFVKPFFLKLSEEYGSIERSYISKNNYGKS